MADAEVAYLERRGAVEAEMAQRSKCPAAVSAHYQMSKAYFESAEALRKLDQNDAQRYGR